MRFCAIGRVTTDDVSDGARCRARIARVTVPSLASVGFLTVERMLDG
jgi:hypothetical protein